MTSAATLASYVHPAVGAVAIAYMAYVGSLAVAGRGRPWRPDLGLHAARAPWAWGLIVAAWTGGVVSVVALRSDLHAASSVHFEVGSAIALLATASYATSRWIDRPLVRLVHPWLGAAALALAGFHVVLGFQLLP